MRRLERMFLKMLTGEWQKAEAKCSHEQSFIPFEIIF